MAFAVYIIIGMLTYLVGKWLAKHPTGVPDLPVTQDIESIREALFAFFLLVTFAWPLFWCVIAVSSGTKLISVIFHKRTA
jgi:hypothetical protein